MVRRLFREQEIAEVRFLPLRPRRTSELVNAAVLQADLAGFDPLVLYADVAQPWKEALRSDRRQCGFESLRRHRCHLEKPMKKKRREHR